VRTVVALILTLVGAVAVMVSPITPWTTPVALAGPALVVPGVVFLVCLLLRNWNW